MLSKTQVHCIEIDSNGRGRRFAVADIHGCAYTLYALLFDKIRITKYDQLFLLGDYVSKGPHSLQVLDLILYLQKKQYAVFALRGNHEQELLEAYQRNDVNFRNYLEHNKMQKLLKKDKMKRKYAKLLDNMPHCIVTNKAVMVHAGLDFSKPKPYSDAVSMMYLRDAQVSSEQMEGRMLVHGHQATDIKYIRQQLQSGETSVSIDNGAVYSIWLSKSKLHKNIELGNLCALNIDTRELVCQPTIDLPL